MPGAVAPFASPLLHATGYIIPLSSHSITERKNLNTKAMITNKRPTTSGQNLTNYNNL